MIDTLKCFEHPQHPVQFINIKNDDERKLRCSQCISDRKDPPLVLSVHKILMSNEAACFEIWPPFDDEEIRERIKKLILVDDDLTQQIIDYFDILQQEINSAIQECKKKILLESQTIIEFKEKIKQAYQQHASINKMQELFNQNLSDQISEEKIKIIITSRYWAAQDQSTYLKNMIDYYEEVNILDSRYRNYDSQKIKDTILNIKFFHPNELVFEQSSEQFENLFKNPQRFQEIQQLALTNILDSEKKMKNLISQIQNDYFLIKDSQNLSNFSQEIRNSDKMLDNFITVDNLEEVENKVILDQTLQWVNLGININNIDKRNKLLQEINKNPQCNFFISNAYQFEKSLINNSQNYLTSGFEQSNPSLIYKEYSSKFAYGYFSVVLKPQNKYIIRLKKLFHENQNFSLGLIKQGNEHSNISIVSDFYVNNKNYDDYYSNKQSKDQLKEDFQIDIQISENIFKVQQNLIQGRQYEQQQNYYFYIGFSPRNSSQPIKNQFILSSFQEFYSS